MGQTPAAVEMDLPRQGCVWRSYSQTQIAGIGTACNVGGYFALFAGLYYDRTKTWNRCALASGTCQSSNAVSDRVAVHGLVTLHRSGVQAPLPLRSQNHLGCVLNSVPQGITL